MAKKFKPAKRSANFVLDQAEALMGNFEGGPADNQKFGNRICKADWDKLRKLYA
jgi:hypothetical protein